MNTDSHSTTTSRVLAKTGSLKSSVESKMPTIAGISLPEIAVLGAAGFVLWKNRSKIQALLEKNGIEVPSVFTGDFSELLQKGATAMGAQGEKSDRSHSSSEGRSSVRRHDA
jgi:hypothetical protein